jgi:hypothetical protein
MAELFEGAASITLLQLPADASVDVSSAPNAST